MTKTKKKKIILAQLSSKAKELLKKGKEDNFLIQDDILVVFSDAEKRIDELDEFYSQALEKKIDILDNVDSDEEQGKDLKN